jgi:hypothetical protein
MKPLLARLPDKEFGSAEEILQNISTGNFGGLFSDL